MAPSVRVFLHESTIPSWEMLLKEMLLSIATTAMRSEADQKSTVKKLTVRFCMSAQARARRTAAGASAPQDV